MAKIKIFVDKDETKKEAEDMLFKALNLHRSGDAHDSDEFDDPAMDDMFGRISKKHKDIFADMMQEVMAALDEEYN